MTEFVSPHLRTVLKTYQDTATKSLHGPAGLSLVHHHHSLHHSNNNSGSGHHHHLHSNNHHPLHYSHNNSTTSANNNNNHHHNSNSSKSGDVDVADSEAAIADGDECMDEENEEEKFHHPNQHHSSRRHQQNKLTSPATTANGNNSNTNGNSSSSSSSTSSSSLSSTSSSSSSSPDNNLVVVPPPQPELPQPILTEPDTNACLTLYETVLEGRRIGCFMVGGELRLCLPQVLTNVLMDFSLDQINCTCERLQIFCSQCTPEQLNEFKAAKILPPDVKTSGLITRTNAERLCAALLCRMAGEKQPGGGARVKGVVSFRVAHRCFGRAEGVCVPELFSIKEPVCIECDECGGWFSPHKFVFHGHGAQEEQTCHWGFDSDNWRAYIHVAGADAEDEELREKFTALLDEMKERERSETLQWIQEYQRGEGALKRKVGK